MFNHLDTTIRKAEKNMMDKATTNSKYDESCCNNLSTLVLALKLVFLHETSITKRVRVPKTHPLLTSRGWKTLVVTTEKIAR